MKKKGRRLCSMLLLFSMVVGLISPGTASASELLKKSAFGHVLSDAEQIFTGGGSEPDEDEDTSVRLRPASGSNLISDRASERKKAKKKKAAKASDSNLRKVTSVDVPAATSSDLAAYNSENNLGAATEVYPLEEIIGSEGKAMYTTLLDKDGNVISTNDPKVNEPENPGEVKAGDAVSVKFRMEEIIPNEGEEGVQENRIYFMSLPEELVPAAESADGKQLVNPPEPLEFFGEEGGIQAYGGIYNIDGKYQLRMIFKNVEEWIEISGHFQYGANISSQVLPGKTYELKYVPGGTIRFTVAQDSPVNRYGNYALSMGGSFDGWTSYYWQVNIDEIEDTDTSKDGSESETDSTVFPFRELTIDSDDAMGVWVNEEEQGIFDAYGDKNGSKCKLEITYETTDKDGKNTSETVIADNESIIKNEGGKTVIRFTADDIQADMEFRKADAVKDTLVQNQDGKYAYITNRIHVHISDGKDGNAKNIKNLALYVPTLTYDDYCRTGDVYYEGKAVLSAETEEAQIAKESLDDSEDEEDFEDFQNEDDSEDEEDFEDEDDSEDDEDSDDEDDFDDDEDSEDEESEESENEKIETLAESDVESVTATGSVWADYGSFGNPFISGGARNLNDPLISSYEYLPEDIYTVMGTGNSGYSGNYYWMEFDPEVENNSGVNYYLSNWSFLPRNYFSGGNSDEKASFGQSLSGLNGMTGTSDFEYLREVEVGRIQGDPNLVANILTPEGEDDEKPQLDVKFQYQLKKVFAQAQGESVLIYRSTKSHAYGEYTYLIIDPQTVNTAQQNNRKNWREYIDGTYQSKNGYYSAKPGDFKIHVFNAPHTNLQLEMTQKIGSVIADDKKFNENARAALTDQLKVGIKTKDGEDDEKTNVNHTYNFDKYPSSYMEGVWADEDTIFWEMTFDTSNWPSSDSGKGAIYVNAGQKLRMMNWSDYKNVMIGENQLYTGNMYVKNPSSGQWEQIYTPSSDNNNWYNQATFRDMTENTTLSSERGDNTYHFQYENKDWTQYRDSNNDVRIGFFTHVAQMPGRYDNPELSCTAEVVVQNGDVSKLYGDYQNQFPSSGQGKKEQYPFKISATGVSPIPSLDKGGYVLIDENSGSKMNAVWQIQIKDLKGPKWIDGDNDYHNRLLKNDYPNHYFQGGYSGVLSVTDDMRDSTVADINGNQVNTVSPGKYTYIKRMLWSGSNAVGVSVSEMRNGGGGGPIPYEEIDEKGTSSAKGDTSWKKYEDGNWVSTDVGHTWDPYHPGIYRLLLTAGGNHAKEPLEVYIYYAGNMCDSVENSLGAQLSSLGRNKDNEAYSHSLVVEYRGLKWVTNIYNPITYTTEFDQNAFREAADQAMGKTEEQKINSYYDVTLKNSAGFGYWRNKGKEPATASVKKRISAQLSIDKKADPVEQGYTGGFAGKYTLKVVNGISPSDYVGVEDFLTKFANVKRAKNASGEIETVTGKAYDLEGENPSQENKDAVQALTRHMKISDLVITAKENENASAVKIYENGAFTSDWTGSELVFSTDSGYSSEKAGSLFTAKLKKASGEIPAEMEFLISYTMMLDMDTADAGLNGNTFRQSGYYEGNGLQVFNNAEASRTYTSTQTQEGEGTKNSTQTQESGKMKNSTPVQTQATREAKTSNPGGTITDLGNGKKLLKVDCGGSVDSTYLTKEILEKKYENNAADPNVSDWLSCAYTGTMGKGETADSITINDSLTYENSRLRVRDPESGNLVLYTNLSETMKANVATVFEHLVEKNSTYKNIKLYYTDTKPESKSDLNEADLIWEVPQGTAGGTEIKDGKLYYPNGVSHDSYRNLQMALTLGDTPSSSTQDWAGDSKYPNIKLKVTTTPASLSIASTDPWKVSHGHAGFTVEAEGLDRQKYLVAAYQVETDWNKVYTEAAKIFGGVSYIGSLKNLVDDGLDAEASSNGNSISITDSSLVKDVIYTSSEAGEGQWRITASTGSQESDELTIEDHFEIQFPEDSVLSEKEKAGIQAAAKAATSIDPASVQIIGNNSVIYKDQTPTAGWENHLEVTLLDEGKTLKVVIKNLPEDKVLAPNQTYKITYNTSFDPAAFIRNGGFNYKKDETGNKQPVEYTVANTATMNYGALSKSDTKERTFKPNIPVGAEKTPGTSDGNTQPWTATADTKQVDRKDFTLSDQVTVRGVADDKKEAFNEALYLSSWSVKVLTYDDDGTTVDETEYTKDTLPPDATLTDLAGNPLEIGKTGVRGFILTFKELPAKHKVQATYVTALDRDKFLAAGGTDGDVIDLLNDFRVSASDGNGRGISAPGRVTIKAPFEKKGDAVTAGKTAEGNPILTWSANVNLTSLYTVEELKDLTTITLTDNLNPALKLISSSVELRDTAGQTIMPNWQMKGNQLMVEVENPAAHPNFTLTFKTECQASLESLTNNMELSVDGVKKTTTKSNDLKDLVALSQYGQITAMKTPDVTIEARKYVDHEICTEAGKYRFELTAVDADGDPLTGKNAYSEIVTNDADGRIRFSKLHYSDIRADLATYYYQIRELPDAVDGMILDDRVFTVEVEIQKSGNYYLADTTVVSPENYSCVEFDNTTQPKLTDFTVTKVWDDNDNAAGLRPEAIVVHLYQDGQPYNNMIVTLNEGNHWTYTWTDLPEAGGKYSAVEDPVENYVGSAVTDGNKTVLTNKVTDQPDKPDKPDTPGGSDHPKHSGGSGSHKDHTPDNPNPDNPTPGTPDVPDVTTPADSGENPDNPNPTDVLGATASLPKTGQLWWPVVILLILGAAMLAGGIYVERKNREKHEK